MHVFLLFLGASLGNLSAGRAGILGLAMGHLGIALPIAIRYSAVRKQFGPQATSTGFVRRTKDGVPAPETMVEFPVIEYQLQQWRLFPYLAATYVLKSFSDTMFAEMIKFLGIQASPEAGYDLPIAGQEIHAITCSAKPLFTWTARDAIQECREGNFVSFIWNRYLCTICNQMITIFMIHKIVFIACGGHGYLKASGLGRLRNDNDANCTYEGENNVLLQQTSNWLLKIWKELKADPNSYPDVTPLQTLTFRDGLRKFEQRGKPITKAEINVNNPTFLLDTYKWLICYLLNETEAKLKHQMEFRKQLDENNPALTKYVAKNSSQAFYARTLSLAFIEHYILQQFYFRFFEGRDEAWKNASAESKAMFAKLFTLYGLWCLEKHMMYLYQGGYASGPVFANSVHDAILELCEGLKMDAVPLVDAIAPTDFVLNSVLGCADGEVYKRMETALSETPGAFQRAEWWTDISERVKSKL